MELIKIILCLSVVSACSELATELINFQLSVIYLFPDSLDCSNKPTSDTTMRLRQKLLCNYNMDARPAASKLTVTFDYTLQSFDFVS